MAKPPADWPRISSALFYDDPVAAIDWLCAVFGFEVRLKVEGDAGQIVHSELELPDQGLVMVSGTERAHDQLHAVPCASPRSLGGKVTQALAVFVDDVDAHCERARAAGAEIPNPPETNDYGDDYWADRSYRAVDLEGHHWWFMQRLRG